MERKKIKNKFIKKAAQKREKIKKKQEKTQ